MQIYNIQTLTGRNIYSHKPVIKIILDIGDLHQVPTNQMEGFNEKLVAMFPGLKTHYCCMGYEGGFAFRLEEGTYIGHVTEHLILELQAILGYNVSYGKTRVITEPSLYYIIFQYENEKVGIACAKAAVQIITCLAKKTEINVGELLEELKQTASESELGPSTNAIFMEAKKRGIPISRIGDDSLLQLGYGKHARLIAASLSDATSCISADVAGNKQLTKQLLEDYMIPVPHGEMAYSEEAAVAHAVDIGYPVVVKPLDGNQGKGVALDIRNEEQLRKAYQEALKHSKVILVERYIKGRDYRILVIGNKVTAVSERKPPCVTGDGLHSIRELVAIENENNLRGNDHEKPLTKIKLDVVAKQVLQRNGLDENYIPAAGEIVKLRDNGNISTGGTARDCTKEIHPHNAMVAVQAAKILGLDIAGIDMTITDISVPIDHNNGAIIEVNAAPGLRMHIYPTEGQSINVAADILDMMYPQGQPYSVPIVSITGTNGKTTTTRLVRHTLSLEGKKVGMTSTSGIYIGDECILKGDNTGPVSAKLVLSNKEVEAAVLETARGGIVRKGLGYDLADVGVVVNVSDDHLGLDGINTIEELAHVKALVIEAVKPDGYAVLNADDEMVGYFLSRVRSKVMLFSRNSNNLFLLKHMKEGGKAVYVHDKTVFIQDGNVKAPLIELKEIPITFDGIVECNIENTLAAVSALYSLGVAPDIIALGLRTFKPDVISNPGRFNVFNMGNFKVMLDYSHNAAGYNAVMNFIRKMDFKRLIGVIGMPGDRLDKSIRDVGKISGKAFSKVYIKEDRDLRGRAQGEVAGILYEALVEDGYRSDNITVINSEIKALETAILDAQPGDLIVMFYEEFEPAVELIHKFKEELKDSPVEADIIASETAG